MPNSLSGILAELEAAATDPELDAHARQVKLRVLRDGLTDALGRSQTYLADAQLRQEADSGSRVRQVLRARQKADLREALLADGEATGEQMDAAGFLSHEELDNLAEEGLLTEALMEQELVPPFSLIPMSAYKTEGTLPEGESLLPWLLTEALAGSVRADFERLHPRGRAGEWIKKLGQIEAPSAKPARRWKPTQDFMWKRYAHLGREENAVQAEARNVEQHLLAQWIEAQAKESRPTGDRLHYSHLKGEQHVHSTYSDGHATIEELAQEAIRRGHKHVVISDHAHHLNANKVRRQHAEINKLNKKYEGKVRIVKGVEANIDADGNVVGPEGVELDRFEHVNVGLHHQKHENAHERLMKALDGARIDVLAHPHTSEGVNYDELAKKAAEKGVALEVNGRDLLRNTREDHGREMIRAAKKHGAKLQFASDSHESGSDFTDTHYGVRLAAQEGVKGSDVHNFEAKELIQDKVSVVGKPPVRTDLVQLVQDLGLDRPIEEVPFTEKGKALLGSAHDTQELYAPDGEYTPARKALHEKLLDEMFAGAKKPKGKPVVLFMAGGGASGKSVALRRDPSLKPEGAISINPDEFKEKLPEWGYLTKDDPPDPHAAHVLHEESATLAAMALDRAYREGYNVLMDAVGNSEEGKFVGKIRRAKKAGYETRVLFVDAPTNIAIERNLIRASTPKHPDEGRFLPIPEQKRTHREAISRIKEWWDDDSVDGWTIWRTVDLDNPIHVAEGGAGKKRTIHDEEQMESMWEKSREKDAE